MVNCGACSFPEIGNHKCLPGQDSLVFSERTLNNSSSPGFADQFERHLAALCCFTPGTAVFARTLSGKICHMALNTMKPCEHINECRSKRTPQSWCQRHSRKRKGKETNADTELSVSVEAARVISSALMRQRYFCETLTLHRDSSKWLLPVSNPVCTSKC